MAYADDTILITRSRELLKGTVMKFINAAQIMGLIFNTQKTKYMEISKRTANVKVLNVDYLDFERVEEFK